MEPHLIQAAELLTAVEGLRRIKHERARINKLCHKIEELHDALRVTQERLTNLEKQLSTI